MGAEHVKIKVSGLTALRDALLDLAPELRRGPAARALRKGADPVLQAAIAATPRLKADIYRRGKMIRKAGTLRAALRVRSSKDTNATGDVGVFVNIKPLSKGAVRTFKEATGRRSSTNPVDPFLLALRALRYQEEQEPTAIPDHRRYCHADQQVSAGHQRVAEELLRPAQRQEG